MAAAHERAVEEHEDDVDPVAKRELEDRRRHEHHARREAGDEAVAVGLAAVAAGAGLKPELLMIPAVISCSCAFMLPVATAPNAIIYGTQRSSIARMAREGSALNVIIAFLVSSMCWMMLR